VNGHGDLSRSVHPIRNERPKYDVGFLCRRARLYQYIGHLVPRFALKSIDRRGHYQFGECFASGEGLPRKPGPSQRQWWRILTRPATVEDVEVCEFFGIARVSVQRIARNEIAYLQLVGRRQKQKFHFVDFPNAVLW